MASKDVGIVSAEHK
jgi:hypothetical protein